MSGVLKLLKNSGRACKPDSVWRFALQRCAVTIIPLGRNSRCGSSNLPEGSPSESFRQSEGSETQRAGPALPSYLVLHHAGFAVPTTLLPPRWALTPPFHPYLRANHADIPKVFLRSATGLRSAGGIFSVALSVTPPLARLRPLVLPGALPTPLARFRCPDFPPARPCGTQPAIVQLTRHFHYTVTLWKSDQLVVPLG